MTRLQGGRLAGGRLDLWAALWGSGSGLESEERETILSPLLADGKMKREGRT